MKKILIISICTFFSVIAVFSQCAPGPTYEPPFACYLDFENSSVISLRQFQGTPFWGECLGQGNSDGYTILLKDTEITVNGTMLIESHVTFDNVIINMTEGSSIKINSQHWQGIGSPESINFSTHVNFINGTIIRGCGAMWAGISIHQDGNAASPDVTFDDFHIFDAYKALEPNERGNFYVSNSTFTDNYIGISFRDYRRMTISNTIFQGDQGLLPAYPGLNLESSNAYIGIESGQTLFNLGSYRDFLHQSIPNTFKNLVYGIKTYESNQSTGYQLTVKNQSFDNIATCVYVDNIEKINVNGNDFSRYRTAIDIRRMTEEATVTIGTITKNTFSCGRPFCDSGISINNVNTAKTVNVTNNILDGNHFIAINLDVISTNRFTVSFNEIADALFGIVGKTINPGASVKKISNNFIRSRFRPLLAGISLNAVHNIDVTANTIYDVNQTGTGEVGINISGVSTSNFFFDNEVISIEMEKGISLKQSAFNNFCCNKLNGQDLGIEVFGTNIESQIRSTTFNSSDMHLIQSAIGVQKHNGNRWKGFDTESFLNHTDMDFGLVANKFFVNTDESNTTIGNIKPETILPSAIAADWFETDLNNNSLFLCDNQFIPNPCDFPPSIVSPTVPTNTYIPGSCPAPDVDTDGDGVCDSADPDPLNPCVPISLDSDKDGICDGLDPDPENSCIPHYKDTDGDGICDGEDPEILNPCVPNGIDLDKDGICDQFDPDDDDANIPYTPTTYPTIIKNINNNNFISFNVKSGIPTQTVRSIEALTTNSYGTHVYEKVNDWENHFNIINFLINNQYYLQCSYNLTNFWNDRSINQYIWDYVQVHNDMQHYRQMTDANKLELIINQLSRERLDKMIEFYELNFDDEILENLYSNQKTLFQNSESLHDQLSINVGLKGQQILSSINALPEFEDFQTLRKNTWRKELAHQNTGLGTADINELQSVAYLCPLEFGAAVYSAQALLLQYNSLDYSNLENLCPSSLPRKANDYTDPGKMLVDIYPNPSAGRYNISTKQLITGIEVYHNDRLIITKTLTPTSTTTLDLTTYADGVYYLKVYSNSEVSVSRIVKIK